MLLTNEIDIQVTSRNFNHYKNKGYDIPMIYNEKLKKDVIDRNKKIIVQVCDLPNSSKVKIQYMCDNCHKIHNITYSDWMKRKLPEFGDLCKECAIKIKLPQSLMQKYGYSNCANIPSVVEKKKKTNLEKYGNEWAIASDDVHQNIVNIFLNKYGVDNPMKDVDIKLKAQKTNQEKYGGNSPMCDKDIRQKSINTCLKKYGTVNAFQSKEIQQKARESLYQNGTTPSSKVEKEMCNMLKEIFGVENCFPNYPEGCLSLDCLVKFNTYKIDFEYDGYYWHKNRKQYDAGRNAVLIKNNYKIVRIHGNNLDILPSTEQIINAVNYLIEENHHLVIIDMNK